MRKTKLLPRSLSLAALLCWAFAALGQTPAAQLTFQVRTPDGLPLQDAEVKITSPEPPDALVTKSDGHPVLRLGLQARANQKFLFLRLDQEGQAQVPIATFQNSLPSDKIAVSARAPGYQPFRQIIELKEQKPIEITLTPLPKPAQKP